MLVMKIVGLNEGHATPIDGHYLQEYDPSRDGILGGETIIAHIVCTPDKEKAMKFNDLMEISKVWKLVDPRNPIRLDGKPNRPLTAFTIMSETV